MRIRVFSAVFAIGAIASLATAAPIGTLDIAGRGNIFVSATTIDFGPLGLGWGNFTVSSATEDFAVLDTPPPAPQQTGIIRDLDSASAPAGPPFSPAIDPFILAPHPHGPPFAVMATSFSFSLDQILPGGGPSCVPAPGPAESCTPVLPVGISPFLLTQRDGSVVGSMEIRGRVMDDVSSGSLPYIGLFTFNLVAVDTVTEALNIVQAGGAVESSWSAQLVAIPEPGTWFGMLGAMLVFGSRYAVRKLRR